MINTPVGTTAVFEASSTNDVAPPAATGGVASPGGRARR